MHFHVVIPTPHINVTLSSLPRPRDAQATFFRSVFRRRLGLTLNELDQIYVTASIQMHTYTFVYYYAVTFIQINYAYFKIHA